MITSERREQIRYFDQYRENVDTTLRNPRVAQKLGDLTNRLIAANEAAFLPNTYWGKARVPREYQNRPEAIALLPLNETDAKNASSIIRPIFDRDNKPYLGSDLQGNPILYKTLEGGAASELVAYHVSNVIYGHW